MPNYIRVNILASSVYSKEDMPKNNLRLNRVIGKNTPFKLPGKSYFPAYHSASVQYGMGQDSFIWGGGGGIFFGGEIFWGIMNFLLLPLLLHHYMNNKMMAGAPRDYRGILLYQCQCPQ